MRPGRRVAPLCPRVHGGSDDAALPRAPLQRPTARGAASRHSAAVRCVRAHRRKRWRAEGLLAQTVFVRAKTLLMQGALPEALDATQRAIRLHKREKPRLVGPFVALKLQLPLLKAKIQKEEETVGGQ